MAEFIGFLIEMHKHRSDRFRYDGKQKVSITLVNGYKIDLMSPIFRLQKKRSAGRPKKRNSGVIYHFGLELLGLINKKSPGYVSRVVRCAVNSSSFVMAQKTLAFSGIKIAAETIRKMTYDYADTLMKDRQSSALDGAEKQAGMDILICIDGGRARMKEEVKRKNKNRKKGSFKANWREPILLTIHCLNPTGELQQQVMPVYDVTTAGWAEAFRLLKSWLLRYNLKEAKQITFCADGGKSIWPKVAPLMKDLGISEYEEVIDYTHAKQHANDIINIIVKKNPLEEKKIRKKILDLLWKGDFVAMNTYAEEKLIKRNKPYKSVRKIINGYFSETSRFQYESFKSRSIPTGSGVVESAIRRVINMKVKGNGIFWYKQNCEKILYLRCQLLTDRWINLEDYIRNKYRNPLAINMLNELKLAA